MRVIAIGTSKNLTPHMTSGRSDIAVCRRALDVEPRHPRRPKALGLAGAIASGHRLRMTDGRPTIFADPAMPLPILLSGSVPRVAQRRDMRGNLAPPTISGSGHSETFEKQRKVFRHRHG